MNPEINFDWVRNTPGKPITEDHFTVSWQGYIAPRFSEEYLFEAKVDGDDGIRIWVDDQLVVDHWLEPNKTGGDSNMVKKDTGSINDSIALEAGKRYAIKISYYEKLRYANAQLLWSSNSQNREVVPTSYLFTGITGFTNGLSAEYRSKKTYLNYTQRGDNIYAIVQEWPDQELVLEIDRPTKITKVNLLGWTGELPWKYKAGKMHIDVSGIPYNKIPGKYAWVFKFR